MMFLWFVRGSKRFKGIWKIKEEKKKKMRQEAKLLIIFMFLF